MKIKDHDETKSLRSCSSYLRVEKGKWDIKKMNRERRRKRRRKVGCNLIFDIDKLVKQNVCRRSKKSKSERAGKYQI